MGVEEAELPGLIADWRRSNPHITKFWWDVDAAAIKAVTEKQKTKVGKIIFEYKTQTSHIKNGICTLKNQYFSPQNTLMRLSLSVPMHPAYTGGDAEQSWQ